MCLFHTMLAFSQTNNVVPSVGHDLRRCCGVHVYPFPNKHPRLPVASFRHFLAVQMISRLIYSISLILLFILSLSSIITITITITHLLSTRAPYLPTVRNLLPPSISNIFPLSSHTSLPASLLPPAGYGAYPPWGVEGFPSAS